MPQSVHAIPVVGIHAGFLHRFISQRWASRPVKLGIQRGDEGHAPSPVRNRIELHAGYTCRRTAGVLRTLWRGRDARCPVLAGNRTLSSDNSGGVPSVTAQIFRFADLPRLENPGPSPRLGTPGQATPHVISTMETCICGALVRTDGYSPL